MLSDSQGNDMHERREAGSEVRNAPLRTDTHRKTDSFCALFHPKGYGRWSGQLLAERPGISIHHVRRPCTVPIKPVVYTLY